MERLSRQQFKEASCCLLSIELAQVFHLRQSNEQNNFPKELEQTKTYIQDRKKNKRDLLVINSI